MTFKEALKILDIEDYEENILNSNSRGELFHVMDYIVLAEVLGKTNWFRKWFITQVEYAKKTWNRPQSVYQHIPRLLKLTFR